MARIPLRMVTARFWSLLLVLVPLVTFALQVASLPKGLLEDEEDQVSFDLHKQGRKPSYAFKPIKIRAPDDSIRATFLPYGAILAELWVKDREGQWRDVTLGFDNTAYYGSDPVHPYFGPIVGRYANRIANGTFTVGGRTYHTPRNENNYDTLHGGSKGYDRAIWRLGEVGKHSISFTHHDPNGNQGFPHTVDTVAEYSLEEGSTWNVKLRAKSTGKTPFMLATHNYWNLNPQSLVNSTASTKSILQHELHIPYVTKYIQTDSHLIPTGKVPTVSGTAFDFRKAKAFSSLFAQTEGICGPDCQGWDSCFVMDDGRLNDQEMAALTLHSPQSGIKMSLYTNQAAFQVYTGSGLAVPSKNAYLPRKRVHGGDGTLAKYYENYSAVVIEAEDWIDGINHPEWGREGKQLLKRGEQYEWETKYVFGIK